jgi:hypothetical protein
VAVVEVDVLGEIGGVEQYDQVLCQHGDGVDAHFLLDDQDRSGFGRCSAMTNFPYSHGLHATGGDSLGRVPDFEEAREVSW